MAELVPFHQAGSLPPDLEAQALELQRKRAIAAALDAQTSQPLKTQMVGDRVVPLGIGEGLAHIGAALMARNATDKADQSTRELGQKYQTGLIDALAKFRSKSEGTANPADYQESDVRPLPSQPGDKYGAAVEALMSGYGPVAKLGELQFAEEKARQVQREKPVVVPPGGTLTVDGKVLYHSPNKPQDDRSIPDDWQASIPGGAAPGPTPGTYRDKSGAVIQMRFQGGKQVDAHTIIPAPPSRELTPGYRWKPDEPGVQEPIPGGKEDVRLRGVYNSDTATRLTAHAALDRLEKQTQLVLDSKLGKVTGVQGFFPNVPGGKAADAKGRLDTLKYQVGIGVLQDLKSVSRNNASGLGQVTEKEHVYLQAQLGNLARAQSEGEIRRVVEDIHQFTKDAKDRIDISYNLKHESSSYKSHKAARPEDAGLTPAEEAELQSLREQLKKPQP